MYSGTLTAVLAVPAYEKPIDSLWDLWDAMKHKGHMPSFVYASVIPTLFQVGERERELTVLYCEPQVKQYETLDTIVHFDTKLIVERGRGQKVIGNWKYRDSKGIGD